LNTAIDLLLIGFGCAILALGTVIAYRVLTGRIRTAGILKATPESPVNPDRAQLLIVVLAAVAYYAYLGARAIGAPEGVIDSLPTPPGWVVTAFGGSHLIYLTAKQARRIARGGGAS